MPPYRHAGDRTFGARRFRHSENFPLRQRNSAILNGGLRRDEAIYLYGPVARLAEALKRRGVDPKLIEAAARELAA